MLRVPLKTFTIRDFNVKEMSTAISNKFWCCQKLVRRRQSMLHGGCKYHLPVADHCSIIISESFTDSYVQLAYYCVLRKALILHFTFLMMQSVQIQKFV